MRGGAWNKTDGSCGCGDSPKRQSGESPSENAQTVQHFREVLLQFPVRQRIPNLDRFSKAQQIINVPVRLSR